MKVIAFIMCMGLLIGCSAHIHSSKRWTHETVRVGYSTNQPDDITVFHFTYKCMKNIIGKP